MINNLNDVIKSGNCISCGICIQEKDGSTMEYKKGQFIPVFSNQRKVNNNETLWNSCPGKGYKIKELSDLLFPHGKSDLILGRHISFGAARTNDQDFIPKASSGGIIPAISHYMLEKKYIDGIITVKFDYSTKGPLPTPFIAKTKKDLIESQGSKYMPVPLLENFITKVTNYKGRLLLIGTPCQIAAYRNASINNPTLKDKIVFTIANYCGGFRDFRESERLFRLKGIKKEDITYFSYRGNGQPGYMSIYTNKTKHYLKYPNYSKLTGHKKHKRCQLCVDATGELSDLSVGDAWIDRFLESGNKWSSYICRSTKAEKIISSMKMDGKLNLEDIKRDELIKSQKGNIKSKKLRQFSRRKLHSLIGSETPNFDGGFLPTKLNLIFEVKVLMTQKLIYFLEKAGLYIYILKTLKRKYYEKTTNTMP